MTYRIKDGWVYGKLPGPDGEVEVKHDPRGPFTRLAVNRPQLVLHTTETDGLAPLQYPSQWQVGEGVAFQYMPLWAKGEALRGDTTNDPYAMQIEIVGHAKLDVWLPKDPSLGPLVALMSFLEREQVVQTALRRPKSYDDWPVHLDRLPAAVEDYYRRKAGIWPDRDGVYGHVEIPGNTHWDPGSLDYPALFDMVRGLEADMGYEDFKAGVQFRIDFPDRVLPEGKPADFNFGWRLENRNQLGLELPGAGDHTHEPQPPAAHDHGVPASRTESV